MLPNHLPDSDALRRLRSARSARLFAFDSDRDEVYIVPVNFALVGRCVYFYTEPGRKLTVLRRTPGGAGVEVDAELWSVLATGEFQPAGLVRRAICTGALLLKYRFDAVAPMWGRAKGSWPAFLKGLAQAQAGVIPITTLSGRQWA